ncbi:hypothetical protein [Streptomyces sp. NPDC086023]|uniref:hypothetical protein n=1 Tax=Streptomyces sp. NPDC086023 TaxID=3365746 RepID=UPI0037D84171
MLTIATSSVIASPVAAAQAADQPCYVGSWSAAWNVRSGTSTGSTLIVRMPKASELPAWHADCSGVVTGGSYQCHSGAPTYNTWIPVKYAGVKRWTAFRCVGAGAGPMG